MGNNQEKETFSYNYSAKEQEELNRIRKKYLPQEEDKMEQIRKLDKSVETPGTVASLVLGVVGTLIFGVGMCCALVWNLMLLAVICGIIGIIVLGVAYPVYKIVTKKQREKVAPEILKLTEELGK